MIKKFKLCSHLNWFKIKLVNLANTSLSVTKWDLIEQLNEKKVRTMFTPELVQNKTS